MDGSFLCKVVLTPSNPQVISNSNLRGSKVLGHVNHDS